MTVSHTALNRCLLSLQLLGDREIHSQGKTYDTRLSCRTILLLFQLGQDFQKRFPGSIKNAKVGFMSKEPDNVIKNPDYREVCSGTTGYVEVLFIELNDPETNFEPLIRFFFQFHDPTTKDRQGNDVGTQYASIIFCDDEEQTKIATKVKSELQTLVDDGKVKYIGNTVETDIVKTTPFVEAHEEHQGLYLYCVMLANVDGVVSNRFLLFRNRVLVKESSWLLQPRLSLQGMADSKLDIVLLSNENHVVSMFPFLLISIDSE